MYPSFLSQQNSTQHKKSNSECQKTDAMCRSSSATQTRSSTIWLPLFCHFLSISLWSGSGITAAKAWVAGWHESIPPHPPSLSLSWDVIKCTRQAFHMFVCVCPSPGGVFFFWWLWWWPHRNSSPKLMPSLTSGRMNTHTHQWEAAGFVSF